MRKQALALTAIFLAGVGVTPASAASVTSSYDNYISFVSNTSWDSPGVKPFDVSLGTLTGVHVDYTSYLNQAIIGSYSYDESGEAATAVLLYDVAGTRTFDLNGSSLAFEYAQSGSYLFGLSSDPIGNDVINAESVYGSFDLPAQELSNFTGGSTIVLVGDWSFSFKKRGELVDAGVIGGYSLQETTLIERLTVTYFYTAAAVPEPATWALMLVGFGTVGMTMRKRRIALA
jgi:hypothetical protein